MEEPFLSPILGIVRVKFLSGRRTDERTARTGDVVCSFFPSVTLPSSLRRPPHFTSRVGQHSVVRRVERRSVVGNNVALGLPGLELGFFRPFQLQN